RARLVCEVSKGRRREHGGRGADTQHKVAVTVEINPDPTGSPLYELVLPYPSGLILPKLVAFLEKSRPQGESLG
ncbi:MAG: hypothetical protein AAF660_14320, partial [Pseudomonadota bacterium]